MNETAASGVSGKSVAKQEVKASEKFWSYYSQDFRCLKFINAPPKPSGLIAQQFKKLNPLSKINPEAIVNGVIVDANELNPLKFDLDMDSAMTWSNDNKIIEREIMAKGYDKNSTMNVHFILDQYRHLDFSAMEITRIDPDMMKFKNLKELHLSLNQITKIENLPPNLEQLVVRGCMIDFIDPRQQLESLQYLNVSSNRLDETQLGIIIRTFPNLLSLDLSYNYLRSLEGTCGSLTMLSKLQSVWVIGNPLSLVRQYAEVIRGEVDTLKYIDGVLLAKEEEEQTKKIPQTINQVMDFLWAETREKMRLEAEEKNKKPGAPAKKDDKAKAPPATKPVDPKKPDMAKVGKTGTAADLENPTGSQKSIDVGVKDEFPVPADVKVPFKVKITVRTLNNLPGVFFEELAEENEQGYVKKDTVMSCYWLEYNFNGKTVDTRDKLVWFVDGNRIPTEEDKILIDFNHSQAFVFELDRTLYKQFAKSLPVKIFTRYPKKKFKPVVDEKKEPEFDVEVQQELLGYAVVDLVPLLKNNSLKECKQRYNLFEYEESTTHFYSIYWPVKDEPARVAKQAVLYC